MSPHEAARLPEKIRSITSVAELRSYEALAERRGFKPGERFEIEKRRDDLERSRA